MAKICTNCGKEIPNDVAFCTECGTKVPAEGTSAPQTEPMTEQAAPTVPICANCGSPLKNGVAFCTECGTPRNGTPVQEAPKAVKPASSPQSPGTPPATPVMQQPIYQPQAPIQELPPKGGKYGVVGTGAFFGLELLFMLPFIGWIVCLIMAFAPKNLNLKHYARAKLIWVLISIALCIAAYFLFRWIGNVFMDYINQATDGMFTEWGDLFEQFKQFENGGTSSLPFN